MFQFAGFPPAHYGFMRRYAGSSLRGFPHSDTRGSPGICPSPRLFAACRVFLRPAVPRHPPCALTCLSTAALPSVASRLPYSFTISLLGLMSLVLLLLCFWCRCGRGKHTYPSRTRLLSPVRPMILCWRRHGKAGGCQSPFMEAVIAFI